MDGDGEQTRDLVHVDDIVLANIYAMQSTSWFGGKTYNVGSGTSVSMNYIRNYINSIHDVEWNNVPPRKGDVKHTLADISAIKKDLGFEPMVSIRQGLKRCFKELK
jgi:nucleoside-diphosphate-sugar epimerase